MNDIFCGSVYREDLYEPLISALLSCSHEDSVIFLGLTRQFSKPRFFELLAAQFSYKLVPHEALPGDYQAGSNTEIGLFVLQRLRIAN